MKATRSRPAAPPKPTYRPFPGDVLIGCTPQGLCYARIQSTPDSLTFVGPKREAKDQAVGDALEWLERHGYVHPTTHGGVRP